jgi:hypothetical protein
MDSKVKVGGFGDFNNKNVFGFFNPKIEDSFPTATKFGMVIDALVPNATLQDEQGFLWNVVRYHDHRSTLGLLLRTNADGVKFYDQVPDASRAYVGPLANRLEGDAHITETPAPLDARPEPNGGKQPFRYHRTIDRMEWSEGDLLQLTGVSAAPGICWYSPNEQGGWMFTSYLTRVQGTVMGRKCQGFSEYATCWAAPGVNWSQTYVERGMVWLIVCNEYEDGTRDLCHLGFNRDDCQFAFMANERGPIKVTRDIKVQIVLDHGRYPKTLFYEIDGEKWRWDGAEHGHLGHPQIGIERGREGRCTRVGETRKLVLSYAWVNFFSDDRIDPFVIEAP